MDQEKEAYWKGYNDAKNYLEKNSGLFDALYEVFNSSYSPPQGHEEAYKAGWKKAEEERQR